MPQAIASSSPPPRQGPWMAATTGFPITVWRRSMRANNRWPWPSASLADAGSWNACSHRMSAPARKLSRLAEPMTSALIEGSAFHLGDHRGQVPGQLGVHRVEGLPGTIQQGDGDSVVDGEMDMGEGEVGGGHGSALKHQGSAEAPGGALGDQCPTRAPPGQLVGHGQCLSGAGGGEGMAQ